MDRPDTPSVEDGSVMAPPTLQQAARWSAEGLTDAEVADRRAKGLVNRPPAAAEVRVRHILARNSFTWINLIFALLGAASLATGAGPDAAFLAIVIINTLVGTVEEVAAKRKLDSLSVLNAPRARVLRAGAVRDLHVEDVVLDDALQARRGDQVVADAVVVDGRGEVDESLVTGESEPIPKRPGDRLLSGSWVVSGALLARVTAVGPASFAGRLTEQARRYSLTGSELMGGINLILRYLAIIMAVIAPAVLLRQLQVQPWQLAVRSTVAALVGMVPEGLVLLATLAFLTGAVRLARQHVLVQELPAVETLARVDVLCADKTGTLTDGSIAWRGLVTYGTDREVVRAALAALTDTPDVNATLAAIAAGVGEPPEWEATERVPFSSDRKWSAASFAGHGTWVLGAPEMVDGADPGRLRAHAARLAATGSRVLTLARGGSPLDGRSLPPGLTVVAVIELGEQLRPDAEETLGYFRRQQVDLRILSGDSPATVGAVAARAGLDPHVAPVDARDEWPATPDERAALMQERVVFGRVAPDQKREMVDALHRNGHVVAMTGDGVNDTVALKEADLGIAMGSGSDVARRVGQIVLLDNRFSVLPSVVSEGRRVLRNVERVAMLFLVKNVYSLVISVVVSIAGWPYPFLPRHMSLISGLAIGLPAFFLAFEPSDERFRPGFVRRAVTLAATTGTLTAAAILLAYAIARSEGSTPAESQTTAVIVAMVVSLWVLLLASLPLRPWKVGLVVGDAALLAAAFFTPGVNTFFSLTDLPSSDVAMEGLAMALAACGLMAAWYALTARHRRLAMGRSAPAG